MKSGLGPGAVTTLSGSETWVDPMVGARAAMALNERWTAGVRGGYWWVWGQRHRSDVVGHGGVRLSPLGNDVPEIWLARLFHRYGDDPQ